MAFVLSDRIKETTTTTSTGTYTLGGAVSGFETFTANLSNGDTTYYCCTDGTDFEVGLGTFASSGTTLARTTIISSSNSNNAVNWSSGSRDIFCTLPGSKAVFKDGDGHASFDDNQKAKFKLPHIGWNEIEIQKESKIFKDIKNKSHMYFVHSFEFIPEDKSVISATADYSSKIVCAVEKDNLFGTQFHPEKSDKIGLKIIDNFMKL